MTDGSVSRGHDLRGNEIMGGSLVRTRVKQFAHYATRTELRNVPVKSLGKVLPFRVGDIGEMRVEFRLNEVIAHADYLPHELDVISTKDSAQ